MDRPIDDPLVDDVREVRRRISAEHGHDPAQLVAYYMELQKKYRDRMVTSEPKEDRKDPSAA